MRKFLKYTFSTLLLFLVFFISPVDAATFTVTKTEDTNDSLCDTDCSLREAISSSTSNTEYDYINFNIPESDPGFINPDGSRDSTGELVGTYPETPYGYFIIKAGFTITDETIGFHINGYSQINSFRNINVFGETINSIIRIQISPDGYTTPFYLSNSDKIHISGLNIAPTGTPYAIKIISVSDNNWVEGCFIGTNINGDDESEYGGRTEIRFGSSYNIIGTNGDDTNDRGERNLIAGWNPHAAIIIESTSSEGDKNVGNVISGNYLRTDKTGRICTSNLGSRSAIQVMSGAGTINTLVGVSKNKSLGSEQSNILGCVRSNYRGAFRVSGYNTTIRGNYINTNPHGDNLNPLPGTRYEINLYGTANTVIESNVIKHSINAIGNDYPVSKILIANNEISEISGTAITLTGETASEVTISKNRIYDVYDKGISLLNNANDLMNHPIITDVKVASANRMYVTLDLDFNPLEAPYTLEFFDNDELSPMGYAQGKYYIGSITTSKLGNDITLVVPITGKVPNEQSIITSTATNGNGSTSEFSPHLTTPNILVDTVAQKPLIESIGLIRNLPFEKDNLFVYFTSQYPKITGNTEPNSRVTFEEGSKIHTTTSDNNGNFNIELSLSRGETELEYYTTDTLENESTHKILTLIIGTEYFPTWLLERIGLIETTEVEIEEVRVEEEQENDEVLENELQEQQDTYTPPITNTRKIKFTDKEGRVLAQATVEIEGNTYITDENGEIEIELLKADNRTYTAKIKTKDGKEYSMDILGVGDESESMVVEVTEENERGIDWIKILIYTGIALVVLVVAGVLIGGKKKEVL